MLDAHCPCEAVPWFPACSPAACSRRCVACDPCQVSRAASAACCQQQAPAAVVQADCIVSRLHVIVPPTNSALCYV
jgi:hypothetical protein